MESYFDTILFALTVIPIFGWFKLLPIRPGRVVSFADGVALDPTTPARWTSCDRTRVELTEGIPKPLVALVSGRGLSRANGVETAAVEQGEEPAASTYVRYLDEDFRVMADRDGEYFVYCRVEEG